MDIYVNVVGGVRLLGSGGRGRGGVEGAVSVVSSLLGIEIRADTASVGEISLLGNS